MVPPKESCTRMSGAALPGSARQRIFRSFVILASRSSAAATVLTFVKLAVMPDRHGRSSMLKRAVLFIGIAIILAGIASADEGMWLFNAFPKARVKAKYGF